MNTARPPASATSTLPATGQLLPKGGHRSTGPSSTCDAEGAGHRPGKLTDAFCDAVEGFTRSRKASHGIPGRSESTADGGPHGLDEDGERVLSALNDVGGTDTLLLSRCFGCGREMRMPLEGVPGFFFRAVLK